MSAIESTTRTARVMTASGGRRRAGLAFGATGLVLIVAGTFAPWLSSGGVLRNSYAIVGILRRLGYAKTGVGAMALPWWPLIGPLAMVILVIGILRWWRTAAAAVLVFGLTTGAVAAGVLVFAGGEDVAGVTLAYAGPVLTVAGAVAAVCGGALVLLGSRRSTPSRQVTPPTPPRVSATAGIGPSGPSTHDEGICPE